MQVFFASVVPAILIAATGMIVLDQVWQRQADEAFSVPASVRIPSHGTTHNLVSQDWNSPTETLGKSRTAAGRRR
jgi:hypothetical protein